MVVPFNPVIVDMVGREAPSQIGHLLKYGNVMLSGQSMGNNKPAQPSPDYPDFHDMVLVLFVRDQMKKAP
jgi:hypothetical protein